MRTDSVRFMWAAYSAFYPPELRAQITAPEHTWWPWRGNHVHVACTHNADAHARVLVIHGAGGHSGALWPIASLIAAQEIDVSAIDLPLYGLTKTPHPQDIRYQDWVNVLVDYIDAHSDNRPLILVGASIGGLLASEVAARSRRVHAVVATCLLNPRTWQAQAHMTTFGPFGVLSGLVAPLARGPLARIMIPMRWVANFRRMSRNPQLSALCARDPLGGGAQIPLGFLASFLRYQHTPPTVPVHLAHPQCDAWTPPHLSMDTLATMPQPAGCTLLQECGHFPIEEPGVSELINAVMAATQPSQRRANP